MRPLGWALIQSDGCPYKKMTLGTHKYQGWAHIEKRPCGDSGGQAAIRKAKEGGPEEITLDFQSLEL